MSRKTIKDFKQAGFKLPLVTWSLNKPFLYVLTFLVGLCFIGGIIAQGVTSFAQIKTPYEPPSPYQEISAKESSNISWALAYVKEPAPGTEEWTESKDSTPKQPLTFEECQAFGGLLPKTLLGTASGASSSHEVFAQVYSPGQAINAFESYKKMLSTCGTVTSDKAGDPATEVLRFSGGAAFTYGDAIVFIKTSTTDRLNALLPYYMERAADTLKETSCVAMQVTTDDPKRNLFVNPKDYTGLVLKDSVNTNRNLQDIPQPAYPALKSFDEMDEPEGPLDDSIPRAPSDPPVRPAAERIDTTTAPFTKGLSYQARDTEGPGCGWAWSGLKMPEVNDAKLAQLKTKAYAEAQTAADKEAGVWINEKLAESRQGLVGLKQADTWNRYVRQVTAIHAKWQWLNNERAKVETPWYNYVEAHNYWSTFDARKAEAKRNYDYEVQVCEENKQKLRDWEVQWGDLYRRQQAGEFIPAMNYRPGAGPTATAVPAAPSPTAAPKPSATAVPAPVVTPTVPPAPPAKEPKKYTPPPADTPSPEPSKTSEKPQVPELIIPAPPEGCNYTPEKPAILSQRKPAEPQPPRMPAGVTIPRSWPHPQ